ncbi:unnamed protein product [Moneuplotes crassus]|uniref:UBC core domain-containing protein n=1 Tax=Euplotes crassus TaxID=5936 RepID=A0AAD1XV07_EUPCR|nr:unnamed protein product [Moneuplotes crassus]
MSNIAIRRIQKEYKLLQDDPDLLPNAIVVPDPNNLYEWNFAIYGLEKPYTGVYHGAVTLPQNYPRSPPEIRMYTPNGRFLTNEALCLSISSYHPESWNPGWRFYQAIIGLVSVMTEDVEHGIGMIVESESERLKRARESIEFNLKNRNFTKLFEPYFSKLRIQEHSEEKSIEENNNVVEEEKEFEYLDIQNQIDRLDRMDKLKHVTLRYGIPITLLTTATGVLGFLIYKHSK